METERKESTSTTRAGNETRTEHRETTVVRDNTPVKAFKLREGRRHYHDGHAVAPGDEVYLSEDQARAFRDKFEPVDADAPFEAQSSGRPLYAPRVQSRSRSASKGEGDPDSQEGTSGEAPSAPPIPVGGGPGGEPLKDPTALDPARQGQQTNEQRSFIDSGRAPAAKHVDVPSLSEQQASLGKGGGTVSPARGAQAGRGNVSTEGNRASGAGAATGRTTSNRSSESDGSQQ